MILSIEELGAARMSLAGDAVRILIQEWRRRAMTNRRCSIMENECRLSIDCPLWLQWVSLQIWCRYIPCYAISIQHTWLHYLNRYAHRNIVFLPSLMCNGNIVIVCLIAKINLNKVGPSLILF